MVIHQAKQIITTTMEHFMETIADHQSYKIKTAIVINKQKEHDAFQDVQQFNNFLFTKMFIKK